MKDRLVVLNLASDLDGKPRRERAPDDARHHAWTADEARTLLATAAAAGPQPAAFYVVASDTGARKGELCGLRWEDVDLAAGKIHIVRQLLKPGAAQWKSCVFDQLCRTEDGLRDR